jgi:hypothetical protein
LLFIFNFFLTKKVSEALVLLYNGFLPDTAAGSNIPTMSLRSVSLQG